MKLLVALTLCLVIAQAAVPTLPQDFTTQETDSIQVHQGDFVVSGKNVCCPLGGNGQCKVRMQTEGGLSVRAKSKNMTSFAPFGTPERIVNDFNNGKEMEVVNGTCKAYCPLQDTVMDSFGPSDKAKFIGSKTINGKKCDEYQWKTTLFGVVVMETSTMCIDVSNSSNPVPIQEVDVLTPFGQNIGQEEAQWTGFRAGFDASVFDIKGIDSCQMGQNCQQNSKQMLRLRMGNYKTWHYYAHGEGSQPRPLE